MGEATIIKITVWGTDRNRKFAALLSTAFLILPVIVGLAFSAGGPAQPPIDTTTLYSTTIAWGPRHADPGRAYDTASGELIFNVYDTLISMGESVTNQYGVWNTFESYWAFRPSLSANVPTRQEIIMTFADTGINLLDPTSYWFQPVPPDGKWYHIEQWVNNNSTDDILGSYDVVYIGEYAAPDMAMIDAITIRTWHVISLVPGGLVTVHHYSYDFNIRTEPVISFVDNTGAVFDTFDVNDVEYTFTKACTRSLSPTWMFNIPCFDQWYVSATLGMGSAWGSVFWAKMIQDAFEILPGNVFRINMGFPFADGAFKQILTQTWAAMLSKEWCLSMGDFDPSNFYVDSDLDGIMDWYDTGFTTAPRARGVNAPYDPVMPSHYCGTGPYRVTTANSTIEGGLVILEKNDLYWGGWPRPGQKSFLQRVQIDYVADWAIRKTLFNDGKSDVAAVPRFNIIELLDPWGDPIDPTTKTVKSIVSQLSMDAIFYTWDINSTLYNPLYTGVFPTGAPADFMNNVHVRNAFSYSFNHTHYLLNAYFGEGICRETPGILGLVPDYYTKGQWTSTGGTGKFNYNLTAMEAELRQAYFIQGLDNKSVWDWGGFHIDIFYNGGSDPRRIHCTLIKAGFDALNAASGKNFQITIQSPDWTTYLQYMQASTMPLWIIGWLADYADAGNWYGPYMHSFGDFSIYQHYPPTTLGPRTGLNKDQLIDYAFKTLDGPLRADMYADLDDIYLIDNPGFPIVQAYARRWQKYWVKGWYSNALCPSQYFYHIYKEDTCWADVSGAIAGIPDLRTDMRDISYIAGHFGAAAPDTSKSQPYDPRWAPGTYGNGGCDLVGDRKIDMKDVAFAAAHFLHENQP